MPFKKPSEGVKAPSLPDNKSTTQLTGAPFSDEPAFDEADLDDVLSHGQVVVDFSEDELASEFGFSPYTDAPNLKKIATETKPKYKYRVNTGNSDSLGVGAAGQNVVYFFSQSQRLRFYVNFRVRNTFGGLENKQQAIQFQDGVYVTDKPTLIKYLRNHILYGGSRDNDYDDSTSNAPAFWEGGLPDYVAEKIKQYKAEMVTDPYNS
jgi:hypothetical protein